MCSCSAFSFPAGLRLGTETGQDGEKPLSTPLLTSVSIFPSPQNFFTSQWFGMAMTTQEESQCANRQPYECSGVSQDRDQLLSGSLCGFCLWRCQCVKKAMAEPACKRAFGSVSGFRDAASFSPSSLGILSSRKFSDSSLAADTAGRWARAPQFFPRDSALGSGTSFGHQGGDQRRARNVQLETLVFLGNGDAGATELWPSA